MSRAAGPKPVAGGTRRRAESQEDPVTAPVFNGEEQPPKTLSVCHSGIFFMDDLNCGDKLDNTYTNHDDEDGGRRESGTGSDNADAAADDDNGGNNGRSEERLGRLNGGGRSLSGGSRREGQRNAEDEQLDVIFRLIDQKDVEGVKGIRKSGKFNNNAKNNVSGTLVHETVEVIAVKFAVDILHCERTLYQLQPVA